MDGVLESVLAALRRHTQTTERLCVGLSGGMDSVVLLHALVQLRDAANIRNPLEALHVHHGLSPNADQWAAFCAGLCAAWSLPLHVTHVRVDPAGQGLEAAARDARYAAYARCNADWILQAHHADDQVETLLLRLSRGTGLRGLAGMPEVRGILDGPRVLRPLLKLPRPQLARYAETQHLRWIEDESNSDVRLDRNFLRLKVLPLIAERFPSWRTNWTRAAQHAADAVQLLDELAAQDAGGADQVELERLRTLSSQRLQNVIRWMVVGRGESTPDMARLLDVERCLRTCALDSQLGIRFGEAALFQYRGRLHWAHASRLAVPPPFSRSIHADGDLAEEGGVRSVEVPELQGQLVLEATQGQGIALRHWASEPLRLHGAEPGGSLRLAANRPMRALKNLWQEAGIPPWKRAWQLRVSLGQRLVWVDGLGSDITLRPAEDEPGIVFRWRPGR